ncbi:MAG: hypothetical protein JO236_08570 [Mycobacterium sp.]|uniref:hypothetical protein n=1 Tax=Mycobacterium sp. TaxID=1785 RepID=UPI001ECD2521|nr:hypothetical protein [Mycobacterium sp.]MBW0017581.1 hypothetical protein [Mycobacterium sp.]
MSQPPGPPGYPGEQNPPSYGYGAPPQPPGYGGTPGYGGAPGYGGPPGYEGAPGYGGPPGYGAPPAGYPPQPGEQFNVGDAFKWAWSKFGENAVALIVAYVIYRAILGGLNLVYRLLDGVLESAGTTTTDSGHVSTSPGWAIVSAVILLIVYLVTLAVEFFTWTALITGCLDIADGRPVTIGSFFRPRNFGPAILAGLLVGLITTVGFILLIIPGVIFAFLAALTFFFVVDRSLGPVDAMKASIATVRANVGQVLLALLATIGTTILGFLACCVGLIVAVPLNTLIWTYTYRKLSGGQVVPPRQPNYQAGPPPGMPPGPPPGTPPGPPPGMPPGPPAWG